jgi:hypothetical protein
MAILCPRCGRQYDVTLFSFGSSVPCDCGAEVSLEPGHRIADRERRIRDGRRGMEEIARGSERIVQMILCADCQEVDVAIAVERLRERAEELFPGRGDFFRMVYESRFDRLMAQWRP